MVCAFQGWNDAGDAASSAVSFLAASLERQSLRADRLRGVLRLSGQPPQHPARPTGSTREIVWPTVEVFEARAPRAPRDLVLVQGVEPSMRWRAFSAHLVDLAEALGVQVVVTLGALLADVPHTRPVTMTGFASDPSLVERLGLDATRATRGRPGSSASCTAPAWTRDCRRRACGRASPTTSPPPPIPRRRSRCCAELESLIGVSVDVSELEVAAADYERQVGLAVQSDPDIQAFVERLEQAAESEESRALHRGRPLGGHARARIPALSCASAGPTGRRPGQRASGPAGSNLLLRRRADDAVVAERAGRMRRRGLEALAEDRPRRRRAPCP